MDAGFVDGGDGLARMGAGASRKAVFRSLRTWLRSPSPATGFRPRTSRCLCLPTSLRPSRIRPSISCQWRLLGGRSSDKRSGPHSLVKLACHLPGRCLPFYAIVGCRYGVAAGEQPEHPSAADALRPEAVFTIRAGVHATMVMDDDRAHIQVAVICLENGIAGHRIRVASPDHKQIYVAEVVSRTC